MRREWREKSPTLAFGLVSSLNLIFFLPIIFRSTYQNIFSWIHAFSFNVMCQTARDQKYRVQVFFFYFLKHCIYEMTPRQSRKALYNKVLRCIITENAISHSYMYLIFNDHKKTFTRRAATSFSKNVLWIESIGATFNLFR